VLQHKCYKWRLHSPCKKTSTLPFQGLSSSKKYWPLQHVLNVLILNILNRQHSVVFIDSDNVMSCNAIVAPEGATFKAIKKFGTCFFAVSGLHSSDVAFFNIHNIQQTVRSKIGRQVFRISTSRNLERSATFRTCNLAMFAIRSLKLVQTTKAKCMKTRRYFWISERAHTQTTGYFFMKVVFDMFLRCLTSEKHFRVFYELRGEFLTFKEMRESVGFF